MKKLWLLTVLPLLFAACDKQTILPETEAPKEITEFKNTHFAAQKVLSIVKITDDLEHSYTLSLSDGYVLEFNRKREIESMAGTAKLPDSAIPQKLTDFVKSNYPDNFIIEWELDYKTQEITLENQLTLEFTLQGDFIRIDM